MSSKLQKAEGGFRAIQLLLVAVFLIFWIYLRINGFGTKWLGAPAGAEMYGTIMFALGIVASIAGLIVASCGMAYVVRTHYARHGTKFHVGRWALEFVTLWLFVGERIMLNVIPANFLPELVQTSNSEAQPTYGQIFVIANAGVSINIFLFAATHILVIVQAVYSRRERKRNHNFGKLDGEAYSSSSYLTTQAQSFDAPDAKQPSFSYSQQPLQNVATFDSPNTYNDAQTWGSSNAPQQQSSYHQQQPSWGGSTLSLQSQQPSYGGGYQPGYAQPGVIGGVSGLTPSYGNQLQPPQQQTYQQSLQNSYHQQRQSYGGRLTPQPYQQQGGYHSRGSSFGTVYGNNGGAIRPSISSPMVQGGNRF